MDYPYTNQLLYIKRNVINVLLRNSNSEPFKIPVNPEVLHVPQYPKLIKCPMDFGTIKMKLDKQVYQTANECKHDFLDVFRNCYIFNEPGSLYVEMALKLENLFKRKMADLPVPEHYAQDSAFHTPKINKVKKGKSMKLNAPLSTKAKIPVNPTSSPNQIMKPDISVVHKRNRVESSNGFTKDEPVHKKTKLGIDLSTCKHIILSMVSKKYNDWNRYFLEPVDVEGLKLHDYYDIIKKPMDLGTVKRKLMEACYQNNEEFADDVKLIFKNCYLYNPEGHEVHRCGKLLEGVFVKLYQGTLVTSKKTTHKTTRTTHNYDDLQPLLQKILKRQTEIDSLHLDIIRRNREIRQSIDFINSTELIKSFKASVNINHKFLSNAIVKKSIINTSNHEPKVDKTISPKPLSGKPELKNENIISKVSSNQSTTPQRSMETTKSPRPNIVKQENAKETVHSRPVESKRTIKPSYKSQQVALEETTKTAISKRPLNHINNHMLTETTVNSIDSIKQQQKPLNTVDMPKPELKKPSKNNEEFNAHLKEIKTWIGSLSAEMGMRIREFINKSENKNVVSVSLLKLKPATINGLYKMMMEPVKEQPKINEATSDLREFTIEDRMQLSQDLRTLGEKFSEKILNIYKKTEDVQSSDGECEIDFQTMKLSTLHSLREFANKCLQKKQDKEMKKGAVTAGQPVGNNGEETDSDSSDSSDSDASDSNSDATSSSSDNDFFNNLPKTTIPTDTSSQSVNSITQAKFIPEPPIKSLYELPINDVPQSINSLENNAVDSTQEESRLTDSSDSDKDEDDEKTNSTLKRPIYSALWNKTSNSDNKKPINTPASKPKSLSIPHPMYNHSTRNQLNESLRQIVQDAQANENVKKQEEELRLVRMKEEEELNRQQMLKLQALNESRKQMHHSENQKKEEDLVRLKELSNHDRRQRSLDIPCVPEREDYHQILCDFEYNIDQDLIMKLVHLDPKQVHL